MGGCLNACCCTEAGLRCHSIITICGVAYFLLNYLLFDRQVNYFEFKVKDHDGTKLACLTSAILFFVLFIVALFKLKQVEKSKANKRIKNKISLAGYSQEDMRRDRPEDVRLVQD